MKPRSGCLGIALHSSHRLVMTLPRAALEEWWGMHFFSLGLKNNEPVTQYVTCERLMMTLVIIHFLAFKCSDLVNASLSLSNTECVDLQLSRLNGNSYFIGEKYIGAHLHLWKPGSPRYLSISLEDDKLVLKKKYFSNTSYLFHWAVGICLSVLNYLIRWIPYRIPWTDMDLVFQSLLPWTPQILLFPPGNNTHFCSLIPGQP